MCAIIKQYQPTTSTWMQLTPLLSMGGTNISITYTATMLHADLFNLTW